MNNDLEQFSEERLEEIAGGGFKSTAKFDEQMALARIALKVKRERPVNSPCEKCKGSGFMDSGGTQPWGEPISVECDCTTPQPAHTEQDGWKLVPITPTDKMLLNAMIAGEVDSILPAISRAESIWEQFLAAAPKPESE